MNATELTRPRSTSRPLTRAQLRELESDLRAERGRLERSLGASADGVGPADASDGLATTLHGRAHARYQLILDALRRIEDGAYGVCAGCRTPIPYGRLLVMPESPHCVACGPRVTAGKGVAARTPAGEQAWRAR